MDFIRVKCTAIPPANATEECRLISTPGTGCSARPVYACALACMHTIKYNQLANKLILYNTLAAPHHTGASLYNHLTPDAI